MVRLVDQGGCTIVVERPVSGLGIKNGHEEWGLLTFPEKSSTFHVPASWESSKRELGTMQSSIHINAGVLHTAARALECEMTGVHCI